MKKYVINLIFSFFVFALCLCLTELLFIANVKFNLIKAKPFAEPEYKFNPNLIDAPPQVISDVEKNYKNYKIKNIEFLNDRSKLAFGQSRIIKPARLEDILKNNKPGDRTVTITDESNSHLLNKVIFNVKYEIDKNGIRKIPHQVYAADKKNIIIIGCSVAFGTGVEDDQNAAYFLKQKMPKYNIYNLGIPGGGMSDMLDDIYAYNRLAGLNKKGGAVVYIFIYDHLVRTFCSLDCYRPERINWTAKKNYYDFDSHGELINYGSRETKQPVRYQLFKFLAKSEFLRFIGYDMPKVYDSGDELKFIKMIKKTKDYYASFGFDFFVDIRSNAPSAEFYENLIKNRINYFMYAYPESSFIRENYSIIGDGHHTEVGNYYHAGLIHSFLMQQGY